MPCAVTEPHWTAYASALGTPIIAALAAVFAGLIAYRQWRTAQDRLKLDLFDHRFEIYLSCMKFLSSIVTSRHVDDQSLHRFSAETRNAKWLLDNEIARYFDEEFRRRAFRMQTIRAELEGVPVGEQRTAMVQAESEIFSWFTDQYKAIDLKFARYLKLRH